MSFTLASIASWWKTTEADVISVITKIKADAVIAEADVHEALNWVAAETPTILAGLQTALGLAEAVGVVTAPELMAANAAVAALNAFAEAHNSGTAGLATDAKSVISGYVAYTQAQAAVNIAKSTAAQAALTK